MMTKLRYQIKSINLEYIKMPYFYDNPQEQENKTEHTLLDTTFSEMEYNYDATRRCLQLADTAMINNKRLSDENYRLRKTIHLFQKQIYKMNETIFDLAYLKETNKMFLMPYFQQFLVFGDKDKKEACPICLENLVAVSNEVIVKTSCGHYFHGTCYYQNRSTAETPDSCGCCRQKHIPFNIGYMNNCKVWTPHSHLEVKKGLVDFLQINVNHNYPTTDEILSQIFDKVGDRSKVYYSSC